MKCMDRAELVSREAPTPPQLLLEILETEQFEQMVGHSGPPSSPHSWTSFSVLSRPESALNGGGEGPCGVLGLFDVCAKDGVED
jgi:hypothetical protein